MSQSFSTAILPRKPKGFGDFPIGKQALGYIRVSDHPQAEEDKASLPEQEHSIRKYCAEKGYFLLEIISDVGRRWEAKKPGFQRLIKVTKEKLHPGDVIVVWKIDRLIGSASTAAAVEPLVDQCGINIESITETFDKRWLLFYAAIGKGETEAKRDRGKLGIRTAVSRRHYVGTPPYGRRLNKEKKVVELDPEEASWYRVVQPFYFANHAFQAFVTNAAQNRQKLLRARQTQEANHSYSLGTAQIMTNGLLDDVFLYWWGSPGCTITKSPFFRSCSRLSTITLPLPSII